jgi:uncharacterized glyoxalase superfamily protein PhnB
MTSHLHDRVDFDAYVIVTDIDREVAALRQAGVTIVRELTKTEYEMLEVEFIDPEGFRICLAQPTSHASQPWDERLAFERDNGERTVH